MRREDLWVYPEDDPAWLPPIFAGKKRPKNDSAGSSARRKPGRPRRDRPAKPARKRSSWMRTGQYRSGGSRYWRFYWGEGHQTLGWMQICGGAATSQLVRDRQQSIDRLIADDKPLELIQEALRQYTKARPGPKPF